MSTLANIEYAARTPDRGSIFNAPSNPNFAQQARIPHHPPGALLRARKNNRGPRAPLVEKMRIASGSGYFVLAAKPDQRKRVLRRKNPSVPRRCGDAGNHI